MSDSAVAAGGVLDRFNLSVVVGNESCAVDDNDASCAGCEPALLALFSVDFFSFNDELDDEDET